MPWIEALSLCLSHLGAKVLARNVTASTDDALANADVEKGIAQTSNAPLDRLRIFKISSESRMDIGDQ